MLLSDVSKIAFSFCFGFLLSPFSWGILYLPIFIIIFGSIDYLFFKGEFTYEYFEHRVSIIFYGILGFIIGRTFHNLIVTPTENFHIKIPKKLITYNFHENMLSDDMKFISSIKKNQMINISDRCILNSNESYYFVYRFIVFSHVNSIYKFLDKTINNAIFLYNNTKDKQDRTKLLDEIKNCIKGMKNIKETYYRDINFCLKVDILINKILEIN